jgi:hypothetical protein
MSERSSAHRSGKWIARAVAVLLFALTAISVAGPFLLGTGDQYKARTWIIAAFTGACAVGLWLGQRWARIVVWLLACFALPVGVTKIWEKPTLSAWLALALVSAAALLLPLPSVRAFFDERR